MYNTQTIIAEVTPQGNCGVSILRISGKKVFNVMKEVLKKKLIPRYALFTKFLDIDLKTLDEGIAIWFPKPYSFTGEDVLELQGHGNPILVNLLLKRILKISGIRMAQPGEFSQRAFLNKKIDLTQAESIMDLISSSSVNSLKTSLNILQGNFSKNIKKIFKEIKKFHIYLEGILNFPDDINNKNDIFLKKNFIIKIKNFIKILKKIYKFSKNNNYIKNGVKVIISGPPNSGKSSLFNKITKKKLSIVTNLKGTTRDLIHEYVDFKGFLVEFIDTAGIRKAKNKIEKIGIKLAKKQIKKSDLLIFVIDSSKIEKKELKKYILFLKKNNVNITSFVVSNKIDLLKKHFRNNIKNKITKKNFVIDIIYTSVKNNIGLKTLKKYIIKIIKNNISNSESEKFGLIRNRQIQEIKKILISFKKIKIFFKNNFIYYDLISEEVKTSLKHLNNILGKNVSNNVLKNIFSKFCVGK
ncbi:tRNA modification GTPase MnmE [Buchnera aphidicola (Drepanosiphum platanoidis)]